MKACRVCNEKKPLDQFYSQKMKLANGKIKTYYRGECNKCQNKTTRKYHQDNRDRTLLNNARREDRKRGLKTAITREQIREIISKSCLYCGESDPTLIGMDRVDNSIGHVIGNIVPCCIRCNSLKRDMPIEVWKNISPTVRFLREEGLFGQWVGHNLGSMKLGVRKRSEVKS